MCDRQPVCKYLPLQFTRTSGLFSVIWVKDLGISNRTYHFKAIQKGLSLAMDSQRTMPFWRAFEGTTTTTTTTTSLSDRYSFSQSPADPILSQRLSIKEEPMRSESPPPLLSTDNNVSPSDIQYGVSYNST